MKIATWNVNSIRMRKELLLKWLSKDKPDVVLLQETKCTDDLFPKVEIEGEQNNIIYQMQSEKDLTIEEYFKMWEDLIIKLKKYVRYNNFRNNNRCAG